MRPPNLLVREDIVAGLLLLALDLLLEPRSHVRKSLLVHTARALQTVLPL